MIQQPEVAQERPLPSARRPSTGARVLLLLLSVAGFALLFDLGFPPGAPDRLPVLVIALTLSLVCAERPSRGVLLFAGLFPCSGLLARLFGGTEPSAWPVLLFAGLAAGWTFRFVYDFESSGDPGPLDAPLRALLAVWALSALVAFFRAHTLWALLHGLSGRIVNGEGLPESTAVRESVFAFSALAGGAAWFFILRRCRSDVRRRALAVALGGVAVSALASVLERYGILPGETRRFWLMTGRLSGGAIDPNSLGVLCGLSLLPALWLAAGRDVRPVRALLAAIPFGIGLFLSGSRSGFILLFGGLLLLLVSRGLAGRLRAFALVSAAVLLVSTGVVLFRSPRGTVGSRLADTFDPGVSFQQRASARPVLWRAAMRLFREQPLSGAGAGAFSWSLPDLLRADSVRLPIRDNPGSAYLQALAETGIVGFALTLLLAAVLVREAFARLFRPEPDRAAASAALSIPPLLAALAIGSHWAAADVSLLFFLLCSIAVRSEPRPPAPALRRALGAAVALYAVAVVVAIGSTAVEEEAFRHAPTLGFHPPEQGSGGSFQWTRQSFAIRVEPHTSTRMGLAHFSPEGRPVRVTSRAGSRTLWTRTLDPGEGTMLQIVNGTSRPQAFRFSVSRSFVPKRLGMPGGDRRRLGVQAIFPAG